MDPSHVKFKTWMSNNFSHFSNHRNFSKDPQSNEHYVLVIGNESFDLDSAISSLAYAYILHYATQSVLDAKRSGCSSHQDSPYKNVIPPYLLPHLDDPQISLRFIPVMHVAKEDLPLRTAIDRITKAMGIYDDLIYLDDIITRFSAFLPNSNRGNDEEGDSGVLPAVSLCLVDHNVPVSPPLVTLISTHQIPVISILDHHVDSNEHRHVSHHHHHREEDHHQNQYLVSPRIITTTASTTSLVVDYAANQLVGSGEQPVTSFTNLLELKHRQDCCDVPTLFNQIQSIFPCIMTSSYFQGSLSGGSDGRSGDEERRATNTTHHTAGFGLGDALICTILIDSVGMSKDAGKRTTLDEYALQILGCSSWFHDDPCHVHFPISTGSTMDVSLPSMEKLASTLFDLLRDTSHLSSLQCLRLDAKTIRKSYGHGNNARDISILIAAVPRDFHSWIAKDPCLLSTLLQQCRGATATITTTNHSISELYDMVMICGYSLVDTEIRRELLFVSYQFDLFSSIQSRLVSDSTLALRLDDDLYHAFLAPSDVHVGNDHVRFGLYQQGNGKASRKQILPIVEQTVDGFLRQ